MQEGDRRSKDDVTPPSAEYERDMRTVSAVMETYEAVLIALLNLSVLERNQVISMAKGCLATVGRCLGDNRTSWIENDLDRQFSVQPDAEIGYCRHTNAHALVQRSVA